jgi:hypothetical protein
MEKSAKMMADFIFSSVFRKTIRPNFVSKKEKYNMKRSSLLCLVLFAFAFFAACSTGKVGPGQVKGILLDANGQPAPVMIFVTSEQPTPTPGGDATPEASIEIKETGEFLVTNMMPGEYKLYFATDVFKLSEANSVKITIKPGETLDLGTITLK